MEQNEIESDSDNIRILSELTSDFAFTLIISEDDEIIPIWASDSFVDMSGYSLEDFRNPKILSKILPPESIHAAETALREVKAGKKTRCDLQINPQIGDPIWMRVLLQPVWNKDRSKLERIVGAAHDITENKRTEIALAEQLHESQVMLQISQMLAKSIDLPSILRQLTDAAVTSIEQAEQAVIHLLDEETNLLEPVAIAKPDSTPSNPIRFQPGIGIAGRVILECQTINVADILVDPRFLPGENQGENYRSLLVSPIKFGEKCIGTISVLSSTPNKFNDSSERVLSVLGSQAAIAIERAQLLKNEFEQRQLAEALREVGVTLGASFDFEAVLNRLLEQINRVVPYDTASIMLIEDGFAQITQMRGFEQYGDEILTKVAAQSFEISQEPHLKQIFESGKPCIVPSTKDPMWKDNLPFVKSWAGAPILAQGSVIGFFSLTHTQEGFYQPVHTERLSAFSGQASLTLQNARLFEITQQRLKEVNILYQISQGIAESLEIEDMLQQVLNHLHDYFHFYCIQVFLFDNDHQNLIVAQGLGPSITDRPRKGCRVKKGEGIVGYVAETTHPFVSNNVNEVLFFVPDQDLPLTKAELAVPLRSREKILGVLDIHHQSPSTFSDQDLQLILTIADQLSIAIEKANLYTNLQTTLLQEQTARARLVQSEKLAALGRIVASVAHELNNPIQAIQNALYLVNLEETLSQQAREDMQVALNEANRMAGLIARLRETYRPATSEEFQPASINLLINEVEKLVSTHFRHNNVVLQFSLSENLPTCQVIQNQIKQVILNISLNAVESMNHGGTLKISTNYDVDAKQVIIEFIDDGVGISPEVLPYIFDPFVTTKEGGTGLGLAITYDIIRRHAGHIDVSSKLGEGSTFRVSIPLEQPAP